jgi:eukaryotic-like serine/threonine-protein kinase
LLGVQKIGRYEVLSHLASGGMGQVYLARSTGLGGFERQVVVKTLDLSITDDDEAFVTMFLDEARLVGALHHQFIAPVYEVGCDDEGRYYLVMDYVYGETAEHVFRASTERANEGAGTAADPTTGTLPLSFALTVVSCVASALDYAHNLCASDGTPLDIVHRDISLSNVMVGYDGAVKLIDFGIAKAANRATKTQVGTLKGKIGYLAPEQVLRKSVDHRADIFALGIVLYELTTGTRAFRGSSDLITLERITSGDLQRPTEVVPGYPAELERIVQTALQVDPDRRFQDAGTMGRELEALAASMRLPLGHAPVTDVMSKLFGEQRRRRRLARGSDVRTDPSIQAHPIEDDDEKTPVVALPIEQTERHAALRRAQRATLPLGGQREVASGSPGAGIEVPLEDLPTSLAGGRQLVERPTPPQRAATTRMKSPERGLAVRPTPTPTPTPMPMPMPVSAAERPSPTELSMVIPTRERHTLPLSPPRPPTPRVRAPEATPAAPQPIADEESPPRQPTGPQLPVVTFRQPSAHDDLADAPTHIMGTRIERDDPTAAETHRRLPPVLGKRSVTGAVVSRVKPAFSTEARTWLVLCALFALAAVAAIVIAML